MKFNNNKLYLDIESEDHVPGLFLHSEDGQPIEVILLGKAITTIPDYERNYPIYQQLSELCDVVFCTDQTLEDFPFYPSELFVIFATDSQGGYFGTIGGFGDLSADNDPIGYVSSTGVAHTISKNLREFLTLITFYPFWRTILHHEQQNMPYNISDIEQEFANNHPNYLTLQQEIASTFHLEQLPIVLNLLTNPTNREPQFAVYPSKTAHPHSADIITLKELTNHLLSK